MSENEHSPYVLLSSPLMHELGDEIQSHLEGLGMEIPHYKMGFTTFANGEVIPRIEHTVRGQHVLFLHALQHPEPNVNVMMMFIANDAMARASAASITLVVPYLPYMRQDRMDKPRAPISARMLANLIESNPKVKHVITIDMHAEQETGFFNIPVDNLTGVKIFSNHIRQKFAGKMENLIMLAPDFGGAVRNRRMARMLGDIPVSIFEKRRTAPNVAEIVSVQGTSVAGKTVIIYEDMIDTGGTVIKVVREVLKMGAKEVHVCATHSILSGQANETFALEKINVIATDSIPRTADFYRSNPWLTKVSIVPYFAEAIREATTIGGSVSKLSGI